MSGSDCSGKYEAVSGENMECGICCHVYDPAIGDPASQIPPRGPFRRSAGRTALSALRCAAIEVHEAGR